MTKKIKWGVIGAGGIADRRTMPAMQLSKYCELVAVMEVNEELAKSLAEKYNVLKWYTTLEDILADDEIDAVYIASPVAFHKEQVIAAARAKKHILCEKPVTINTSDADEVLTVCNENNVMASAGFMMRFHSLHKKMREIISEGKIGNVVSCRASLSCWFPEIVGNWRQKRASTGGGALMDMGIHCIDLLSYLTSSKCEEVFGFCETKTFKYDIDDSSNVVLKLSCGATAYVDVNYNIPDSAAVSRLEIYGDKGSLIAEGTIGQTDTGTLRTTYSSQTSYDPVQERNDTVHLEIPAANGNMYTEELDSFALSILNYSNQEIPFDEAFEVQKVVETAYKSSEIRKSIKL